MPDQPTQLRQPWGPNGPTIKVGERDPVTGYVPVALPQPKWSNQRFLSDEAAIWQASATPKPD